MTAVWLASCLVNVVNANFVHEADLQIPSYCHCQPCFFPSESAATSTTDAQRPAPGGDAEQVREIQILMILP